MRKPDLEAAFVTYARMFDLTGYEREFRFYPTRRWRFDFCWPAQRVAVEIDGGQWISKGGYHARDSHRIKGNTAVMMGWRVLHFSGEMLKDDPIGCIKMVKNLLGEVDNESD